MVSFSNHARTAFDKLRLNGYLCNSFSITYARVNNPRDYAWLVQRESSAIRFDL